MIDVISATRQTEQAFWAGSALGLSLLRLHQDGRFRARVAFENQDGLPVVYNRGLQADDCAEICLFVHDDVWLDDCHLADRLIDGLSRYDVIGVAGNRRRVAGQPAWAFVNGQFQWDDREHLSGSVGHGQAPFGKVSRYGPSPADCELLDGVLLAARTSTLRQRGVLFDPRFRFHFYDLDFCRTARQRDLRVGSWPISITHQSGGAFGTLSWREGWQTYLGKWGD